MSKIFFTVWFLLISISHQLLVFGTPVVNSSLPLRSQEGTNEKLQIGALSLQEIAEFEGKIYWLGNNAVSQATARTICTAANFDLLTLTGRTDEYNHLQSSLNWHGINSHVWTDYSNVQEKECYRSHGNLVANAQIITPVTNPAYIIGLAMFRFGEGLYQFSSHTALRYICTSAKE